MYVILSYAAKNKNPDSSPVNWGWERNDPGLRCEYNTTFSNTDGLGTVYMEGIYIKNEKILFRLLSLLLQNGILTGNHKWLSL